MTDAQQTRWLQLWQDFQDGKRTRTELVLWFARGQDIENFLAQLPHLPVAYVREIEQYARDPVGEKELLDVLFERTYPGLSNARKAFGGVDLFCDLIGVLHKRHKQSPDSPATVVIVALWTLLVASPWIMFSFLVWVLIGPLIWRRKNLLKRRLNSSLGSPTTNV
jgi:hypothetical protein